MAIDIKSVPKNLWVSFDDNPNLISLFRKHNKDLVDESKELLITEELGSFNTSEYYFDSEGNELMYSGELLTPEGKVYVSLTLPLSDEVLIDVLEHSVKKLNKLKSAMESLK